MIDKNYTKITKRTSALAFSLAFLFANPLFAQNDSANPTLGGGNSQNPVQSAVDSNANRSNDSKDLSVDYDRLALADSSANHSNDSKDLSQNHSNDSAQNIHKHIILAQNENATDSTNPNATSTTDSNANTTNPSANPNPTDSSNSNADSTESTEPTLLDKVLGIGDTMRGKSDSYDLGRIERTVGGDADENSTVVVVSSEDMEQEGAKMWLTHCALYRAFFICLTLAGKVRFLFVVLARRLRDFILMGFLSMIFMRAMPLELRI